MGAEFPLIREFSLAYAGYAQAVDGYLAIFRAPFDGVVTAGKFMPSGNITGNDTNRRDLDLVRWNAAGVGGNTVAKIDFISGVDAEAQSEIDFTLQGDIDNQTIAEGEYLHLVSDAVASGVADPGGLIVVTFERSL